MKKTMTMTKRGFAAIVLEQEEGVYRYTASGVTVKLDGADALNGAYKELLAKGWTVKSFTKVEDVEKVAAPAEPEPKAEEKPKKTRQEALTERYGDKEARKAYVEAKKAFHRYYMVKVDSKAFKDHKDYLKAVDQLTADALKKWEAAGRPAYNC